MSKPTFKQIVGTVRSSIVKHSPELLIGVGIAGMVTSTVLAVRATPKAMRLLEVERDRREKESPNGITNPISKLDTVKIAWKCYIPSAVIGTASIACLIGASSVHTKRNAVLATAYKLSESALTEYREKVIETIGEKKEQIIRDNIAKDRVEKNPVSKSEILLTERGTTLCCDGATGRYFKSDINRIKKGINDINARLLCDSYISVNEFYEAIGIPGIQNGDRLGWNIDKLGKDLLKIHFSPILADDDTPCMVLDFAIPPYYEFDKFFK